MPVTVDANIVVPRKSIEMALASSGMLARNCTPWLIAPAGGAGGAAGVAAAPGSTDRGSTTAHAAVRRRRSTRETSPYDERLLLAHQNRNTQMPALAEPDADAAQGVELLLRLDALGEDGRTDLGGEGGD